jgi:predicted PurR-regulated permease PerM
VSMVEVGTLIAVGLWLLGVPLALTVALLTAALGFIPNIGPVVSAVPAVLLALTQGPAQALYVALLYLGVQSFDGYVVTPLVQQRTVSLPPALLLLAQVLLGVLLGGVALTLATPLAVVALVLVKKLYVEGVLEGRAADAGAAS